MAIATGVHISARLPNSPTPSNHCWRLLEKPATEDVVTRCPCGRDTMSRVRQVVVLPAKNVAQVTADYRIGVSAASTICGIKRRGLDGLSIIFPRYGGLETILALRARS